MTSQNNVHLKLKLGLPKFTNNIVHTQEKFCDSLLALFFFDPGWEDTFKSIYLHMRLLAIGKFFD